MRSRSHPIPASSYHQSWAMAPAFRNGRDYGGTVLPLGPDWGGPLFLSQYPFLGIDPRGLRDAYADYGVQARAHALRIEHAAFLDHPALAAACAASCATASCRRRTRSASRR